jgi:hypothetical protein
MGKTIDVTLLLDLGPPRGDGILKKFLVLFGDLHEADSHAKGVFVFIKAVHVSPHDFTGEAYGLAIGWNDGHAEIFVDAEGFIASHIDPA